MATQVTFVRDDDGAEVAEAFCEIPDEGWTVTLDDPRLGGRVDCTVIGRPHLWLTGTGQGARVRLMPVAAGIRIPVRPA